MLKNNNNLLKDQYDVILIGAGIGGLVCANYLSMRGYHPLLLEMHDKPGGYLTGFYRKGFYFDAGVQSFGGSNIIWPSLQELGLKEKLEFQRAKWRFIASGIDIIIENLEEVSQAFSQAFPEEKTRIIHFFTEIQKGAYLDTQTVMFCIIEIYKIPSQWKFPPPEEIYSSFGK